MSLLHNTPERPGLYRLQVSGRLVQDQNRELSARALMSNVESTASMSGEFLDLILANFILIKIKAVDFIEDGL